MGPIGLIGYALGLMLFSAGQVSVASLLATVSFSELVVQRGWLARILSTRLMTWLGGISYSLYLTHPFVLDPLRRVEMKLAPMWGTGWSHVSFIICGAALALALAMIAHEWIEVRATRMLQSPV